MGDTAFVGGRWPVYREYMSILPDFIAQRLGLQPDPRELLRPLWHRLVEISREPRWYKDKGAADDVPGRFDMVTTLTAFVLLRMEKEDGLAQQAAYLTELFVEDMDGQLRESGVGDLMVGKRIGKLVSVLGGRIGAYRKALSGDYDDSLEDAVERNVTLAEGGTAKDMAERLLALEARLAGVTAEDLAAGNIPS